MTERTVDALLDMSQQNARLKLRVQELEAELETYRRGERHIIELREDGWTIQHPLTCRPNLFDCITNTAGSQHFSALAEKGERGRFYFDLSEDGRIMSLDPVK